MTCGATRPIRAGAALSTHVPWRKGIRANVTAAGVLGPSYGVGVTGFYQVLGPCWFPELCVLLLTPV